MSDAVLRTEGLTKAYGSNVALDGVTLEVPPGVTGLLGPNGAGKSTMLQCVLGLLPDFRGKAEVLGLDARRQRRAIRRRVGFMPELDAYLFGISGLHAVRYLAQLSGLPRREALRRAHEVLTHVGLGEAIYRKVDGYSTGMRQRFKLAQAIAHEPHVVVLDEPMNGLDPPSRRDFADAIRRLGGEGRCVLVSSHVLHEVESVAERIVVMQRGRMLADGTPRDLRAELAEVPLTVRITTTAPADLAERLVALEGVRDVERGSDLLQVRTTRADALFDTLAALAAEEGAPRILSAEPVDESLEAVFEYLTR